MYEGSGFLSCDCESLCLESLDLSGIGYWEENVWCKKVPSCEWSSPKEAICW